MLKFLLPYSKWFRFNKISVGEEGSIERIIDRLKNPEGLPEGLDWRIRPWPEGFFNLSIIISMDPHSNWKENFAKMAIFQQLITIKSIGKKRFFISHLTKWNLITFEFEICYITTEILSNRRCIETRNKIFSPSSMDYQSIEVGQFNGLENLMTIFT